MIWLEIRYGVIISYLFMNGIVLFYALKTSLKFLDCMEWNNYMQNSLVVSKMMM